MKSPKRIFISSTCFDLVDARAELKRTLEDQGYIVNASDASDFPVHKGLSPVENCLRVVSESDIYILIIHTRYGAPFKGNLGFNLPKDLEGTELSITFAEYLTAKERGLEIRIWVRDFIWSNCPPSASSLTEIKAIEALPKEIDPSVFVFLNYLKGNPHDEGGSWINRFHDIVDLSESVTHWLTQTAYRNAGEFHSSVIDICELLG